MEIAAGYDGEFGTIKIFESGEREHIEKQEPAPVAASADAAAGAARA